jgi:hypothetical protein
MAKEVLVLVGKDAGASITQLSGITGLDTSRVSRRFDAARMSLTTDSKLAYAKQLVEKKYNEKFTESQD